MGETQKDNDLFFTCSLIEFVARKTKNSKKYIVKKLGKERIEKIYKLAEVYHSENIENVAEEFINECGIKEGNYDVTKCENTNIPTYWDVGKVYKRLIISLAKSEDNYINKLVEVMSAWIIEKIDNYDSSMYYENPSYLLACYEEGEVL